MNFIDEIVNTLKNKEDKIVFGEFEKLGFSKDFILSNIDDFSIIEKMNKFTKWYCYKEKELFGIEIEKLYDENEKCFKLEIYVLIPKEATQA
jgi:hypothetical protein